MMHDDGKYGANDDDAKYDLIRQNAISKFLTCMEDY